VVDHEVSWEQVRVHKPSALRFAGSVGLVIYRRPSDFLDTSQTLKGTTLTCQDGER
jgi:hypothetical protein